MPNIKKLGYKSKYGRRKCKNVYTSKCTEKYILKNLFKYLPEWEQKNENIWSMDFAERKIGGKRFYLCAIIGVNTKIVYAHNFSWKIEAERKYTEEEYRKVVNYYMHYYNNERQHSSLDYKSPMEAIGLVA